MDIAVASEQTDRLRVVTADDCTLADLSALQGYWTQAQYLRLTNEGNRLIEFTDGCIEFLPMPTQRHQAISRFLFRALDSFVREIGGEAFYAPLRLRIRDGKFREPDLLLVRDADDPRCRDDYWLGADLVVEVVSPDNPDRDMVDKAPGLRGGGHPRVLDRQPPGRDRDGARACGRRIPRAWRVPAGSARRFGGAARFLGQRPGGTRRGTCAS